MAFTWTTETGNRPDLEALTVNPPDNYIGHLLYPLCDKPEKSGQFSYNTLPAGGTVTTNRTDGNAPTTNLLTLTGGTYTAGEAIYRAGVTQAETTLMGDIATADAWGGETVKLTVAGALEKACYTQLVNSTNSNTISGSKGDNPIDLISAGCGKVKGYHGKRVLVLNRTMLAKLCNSKAVMSVRGLFVPQGSPLSVGKEALLATIGGFFGVDDILIADETIYSAGTTPVIGDSTCVVAVIPQNVNEWSFKRQAELGRTFRFLPKGSDSPITIESYPDYGTLTNIYTGVVYYQVKELNPKAKCIIDMSSVSLGGQVVISGGTVA